MRINGHIVAWGFIGLLFIANFQINVMYGL